jgi:hypothetical protein
VATTPAGCLVLLDGKVVAATREDGLLVLPNLRPGTHEVVVRKDAYREQRRRVELEAGERERLDVALDPFPGVLAVTTDPPDGVEIQVDGLGTFREGVSDLELAPGDYQITASKPGHRPATVQARIRSGETSRVRVALEAVNLDGLEREAESLFNAGQYDRVIALCEEILEAEADRPRAYLMLGASYFRTGRYAESVDPLARAVRGGEEVLFSVALDTGAHGPAGEGGPRRGYVVLRDDGFGFRSVGDRPGGDFFVPFGQVSEPSGGADRLRMRIGLRAADRVSVSIADGLDVASGGLVRPEPLPAGAEGENAGSPSGAGEESLHGASLQGGATSVTVECPECPHTLEVLLGVLRRLESEGPSG